MSKQFIDDDVYKYDEEDTPIKKPQAQPPKKETTSQVIKSKPTIEFKEETQNPYKERYTPKTQKSTSSSSKKLISISQKNVEVVKILKEVSKKYPSESDFICQAIIEKYKRDTEVKETDIKTLVKAALEELVGEKYIIMKGSQEISFVQPTMMMPNMPSMPTVSQTSINDAINKQEKEENENLLASMLDDMDDDI